MVWSTLGPVPKLAVSPRYRVQSKVSLTSLCQPHKPSSKLQFASSGNIIDGWNLKHAKSAELNIVGFDRYHIIEHLHT